MDVLIDDISPAARRYLASYIAAVELGGLDVKYLEASPIHEGANPFTGAAVKLKNERLIIIDTTLTPTLRQWLHCLLHELFHHKAGDWSGVNAKAQEVEISGKTLPVVKSDAEEQQANEFAEAKLHTWRSYAKNIIRSFQNEY